MNELRFIACNHPTTAHNLWVLGPKIVLRTWSANQPVSGDESKGAVENATQCAGVPPGLGEDEPALEARQR